MAKPPKSRKTVRTMFLQIMFIYRIMDQHVYVLLISDGRRDMQALLQRRLLEA